MEYECRQRHHVSGPWFAGWHNLEIFPLSFSARNDFYNPIPHGWEFESNRCSAVIFLYFAHHLHTSGSRLRENSGRITEVKIETTTLAAFLRTVYYCVISGISPDDMTRVSGECGFHIRVAQGIIRKWFELGTVRVLQRKHRKPILEILAIARLVKVDWDVTDVVCIP